MSFEPVPSRIVGIPRWALSQPSSRYRTGHRRLHGYHPPS